MAYILADIINRVQQRVRDTSYNGDEITQYLNDTQNDIFNEYRLNFMETSQDYTTVSNVSDITNSTGLPDNYLVAIDLVDISNTNPVIIPYKDIRDLDELYVSPDTSPTVTTNRPQFWYKYAGTINLYPTPNAAYSLRLRYYKMPTQLADDSDIPELPYSFQEALVCGAAYRVMQVKDNYDKAAILQNKYDEILQKLVGQTAVNQVGQSPTQRINRYAVAKRNF